MKNEGYRPIPSRHQNPKIRTYRSSSICHVALNHESLYTMMATQDHNCTELNPCSCQFW